MRHKESAIAVMIAVMLGTASLFGGFSLIPALATHDPDAIEIASETITQGDGGSMIIDAVELTADKSSRASGTVTIELIQDGDVLRSGTLRASSLSTSLDTFEVDVNNINVTGSFEILVEYLGSGRVTVSDVGVVEDTQVAEDEESGGNSDADEGDNGSGGNGSNEQVPSENIIATKTITPENEEGMTVDTVEFAADKSSRASGTVTVAIVQDDAVLDSYMFRTGALGTSFTDMEASFDAEVTDTFQVVFMYEGSGRVTIMDINVPGATEPAEEPPTEPTEPTEPNPDGTAELTVKAIDQNDETVAPGLFVAVLQGMTLVDDGLNDVTFTLDAGENYIVEMGDYFDEDNAIFYEFEEWIGSGNTDKRTSVLLDSNKELTARYTITTNSPPPEGPTNGGDLPGGSPPPDSAPGTITAYAYRIPSSHWGSTFVGANAQMYFVVYNSTGWIVYSGYFDENGHMIAGLNEGETYWISPTDCEECHDDPHDVVFRHWEDSSTERQRPVTTGMSVGAYYEFVPPS